jgi:hypothetical protein
MSPTPTPPRSEVSVRSVELIRDEMLSSGLSTDADIVGCTEEEIARVVETAEPVTLPDDYLAFLRLMGRKSRPLFVGSGINYPEPLDAVEAAEDIASGADEALSLQNRFFFGHHQGYIVYFFEAGSPAVYGYKEGDPQVHKLADTFAEWMSIEWTSTRESLAEIARLQADTEATRAILRDQGKLN